MRNQSFVGRVEIMGRDEILGWARKRRRQSIRELKARAASGDQRAIARLRRLQAELSTAITATPAPANTPTLFASSLAAPYAAPTYPQQTYSPYVAQPAAYQSPYFDASLSQDPYGPPPQPTIDVFQGDDEILGILLDAELNPAKPRRSEFMLGAFVGDDERELAREGGSSELAALRRRTRR
jgi:hypothetical protein